jgi:two-component system nitrogen regulation sensor histidine kinase GlnL
MNPAMFSGLEMLATAVFVLDEEFLVTYTNPAAENLFAVSAKHVLGLPLQEVFADARELAAAVDYALQHNSSFSEHDLTLVGSGGLKLQVSCTVTPLEGENGGLLLEFHQMDQQLKVAREERMALQQQANRELIRNLAHEIKNPLGGIRGAAQLLERELPRPNLREYTQVIIKESDRLQSLMDRLLTPHRLPHIAAVNIHEVLERVRSVLLAETPHGILIRRDYDTSIPELSGNGEITLRTRIARQVTLAKKRHRLAAMIQVIDNGPGIPEAIRERIFYPLVSGRADGSGLGLTLAQTFVNEHHGTIECDSRPGHTRFTLLLPLAPGNQ